MVVHQQEFIRELLNLYSLVDCEPAQMPLPVNVHLHSPDGVPLSDPTPYRQLIGKSNFLVHTRPDISFTVQHLSQFNQSPTQMHYDAALHVLKYLKGTITQGLFFNNQPTFELEAFYDSDWAACPTTRRSVSGYFILFGGTPISWK